MPSMKLEDDSEKAMIKTLVKFGIITNKLRGVLKCIMVIYLKR